MAMQFLLGVLLMPTLSDGCAFARYGEPPPFDEIHQKALGDLQKGKKTAFIPDRLSTDGNAFTSLSLIKPAMPSGGSKLLADVLIDFAAAQNEDMCYWSFQPLGPPQGQGADLLHPFRHYWDIENGQYDEDLEWQSMLSSAAAARLKRIQDLSNGTLMSTACAAGRDFSQRRCKNGKGQTDTWFDHCAPAILNQDLRWGMAVTIWKISPSLKEWVRYWRSNNTFGHTPNIQWTYRGGSQPTKPWNAPIPGPDKLDPPGVPQGPLQWPSSKGKTWGAGTGESMLAKVLPCSQVPSKFQYPKEQYYCDHVSQGASKTTADEAYAFWKTVKSAWPPTKKCKDDVPMLNKVLGGQGAPANFTNCKDAYAALSATYDNFDCDIIVGGQHQLREVCCSQCGSQPIPDLPPAPAPSPPPAGDVYRCSLCGHTFDAKEDAGGVAFKDLPDSWRCPICGLPASAYHKISEPEQEQVIV